MSTTTLQVKTETSARRGFLSSSVFIWLTLVGYLLLVKTVILPLLPPLEIDTVAMIFAWGNIVIFSLVGLAGVWLADRTGFMPALDPRVSNRQRYLIPLLIGGIIGTLALLLDLMTQSSQRLAELMGESSFNTDFPASLFVYTGGTVLIEAIFRLFIFPALLGLISYVILKKRWQEQIFWGLAILLSLLEPLGQFSGQLGYAPSADPLQFFLAFSYPYFVVNYILALSQAYVFRTYGFLASFTLRIGYYIIWHIVYGSLIFPLLNN